MNGSRWRQLLLFILIALALLIAHEGGHIITAVLLGGELTHVEVMPGIQLYPTLARQPWSGNVAGMSYTLLNGTKWQYGLIELMGGGLTTLIGDAALASLLIWKPRQLACDILWMTALCAPLDAISYSIFPLFGWRHWVFIGGATPEPLDGALRMGLTSSTYFTLLALHTTAFIFILRRYWKTLYDLPPIHAGY